MKMKASFLIAFSNAAKHANCGAKSFHASHTRRLAMTTLLSAVFLIVPAALKAQTSPCSCKDKADLINQLNKTSAALNKLQQYLTTLKPTDMTDEIPSSPMDNKLTWKQIIDAAAYDAGYYVEDTNAGIMAVMIDSVTCGSTISAGTPCLRSLAEKISKFRESDCRILKNPKRSQIALNYVMSLSDTYRLEIAEIIKYLRALPKGCINDWFGLITYNETTTNNSTIGNTTVEDNMTRTGRMSLNGPRSRNGG